MDAAVSFHWPAHPIGRFVAIAAAAEGAGPHGDKCRFNPSGGCSGPLTFRSVSALAGADYTIKFLSTGAAVGPSLYVSSDHITAAGLQTRIQLAAPVRSTGAFVITGRRSWLPNYRGARYEVNAVTIGIRLRLS